MKEKYGPDTVVSSVMSSTYTGIQMILNAVNALQSTERKQILKYLYKKTFSSPSGQIRIESNHHLSREIRIGKANLDGQFKIVWSSEQPIPAKPLLTNTVFDSIDEKSIWESLVEEIGKETSDGIVVVDQNRMIVYVNSAAYTLLRAKQGDFLKEVHLQELDSTYQVIQRNIGKANEFSLFLLKKAKQPSILIKKPSTQEYKFGHTSCV
ncbi:substrate-binding family protein [Anoxybacillus vitaminiphilus]|uniref:Substrate-binding family protein n=1 Tax=Paranoxybacillus vitaminiphilus TaxID=581036 RepID=A0A327Y8U2_9BACL|nr:transporter substrate-binding protein [Anoxybacillus vitaminiphilus]RAK16897.1 substrate-binding family protein [Anoxybacillus vitaminiphilus]